MSSLLVSETFKSIQGEGVTAGVPSVFLRLKGCNLTCGGINTVKTKQLDNGATWRCDTIEVWRKGKKTLFSELVSIWEGNGSLEALKNGAHLIITGGEPLLHQKMLMKFLIFFNKKLGFLPFIEIETNATILPLPEFDDFVTQYNVSPKLSNSGMSFLLRYNDSVLMFFSQSKKAYFKFVILNETDYVEIFDNFISIFKLDLKRVIVMPAASTRKELNLIKDSIELIAKKFNILFSTRLQIEYWDKTVGV